MSNEILDEVREIKETIAREHDNDIGKLVAYFRGIESTMRYYGVPEGNVSKAGTVFDALDRIEAEPDVSEYRGELERYLERMREANLKDNPFDEPLPSPDD